MLRVCDAIQALDALPGAPPPSPPRERRAPQHHRRVPPPSSPPPRRNPGVPARTAAVRRAADDDGAPPVRGPPRPASPMKPFPEREAYTAWDESGAHQNNLSAASCRVRYTSASGCCSLFDASAAAAAAATATTAAPAVEPERRRRQPAPPATGGQDDGRRQLGAAPPAAKDESSLEDVGRLVGAPRVPRPAAVRPARATTGRRADPSRDPTAAAAAEAATEEPEAAAAAAHTSSTASLDERLALRGAATMAEGSSSGGASAAAAAAAAALAPSASAPELPPARRERRTQSLGGVPATPLRPLAPLASGGGAATAPPPRRPSITSRVQRAGRRWSVARKSISAELLQEDRDETERERRRGSLPRERGTMEAAPRLPTLSKHRRISLAGLSAIAARNARTVAALRSAPIFAQVGETQLNMIASTGEERGLPRYRVLYREGSAARSFYVLLSGTVQLSSARPGAEPQVLSVDATTKHGLCLGVECLSGMPRTATVTALNGCKLLHFAAVSMLEIHADGAVAIAKSVFRIFVENELSSMPLFDGLAPDVLSELVPLFQMEEYGTGNQCVFEQGAAADKFYVLLLGSVVVQRGKVVLARLHAEGASALDAYPFFGEMAVLESAPRMAEVRTLSPCKMLVVARRQFSKFLALVPDIRQRLERTKQLRKKQSELTVQYNEDGAVVRADRLRKLENDARRGSDLQHYSWAVEQHVPAFSTAAATRIQRRWRRTLSDRRDRRCAAAAARRAPPPPSLTHTQSARAAGEASPRRPVRPRRGSALRR